MKFCIQFRQLFSNACMLALVVTAAMNSPLQAQQSSLTIAEAQADSNQPLTFQYLFFWKENDTKTQSVLDATQKELAKLGANVSIKQIGIKDPANAELVEHYGVSRAPMPLVVCTASNGAVTKAFVSPFPAAQLQEGIVSRGTAESLKALQENKLVVLCALNGATGNNKTTLINARALKADQRFAQSVEVIAVDVRDPNEASLLAFFKLNANTAEPTTVILAPPGKQLASFSGAVTSAQIAEKLVAAQSACCPGGQCGPGAQCCPGGNCAPQKK